MQIIIVIVYRVESSDTPSYHIFHSEEAERKRGERREGKRKMIAPAQVEPPYRDEPGERRDEQPAGTGGAGHVVQPSLLQSEEGAWRGT